MQEVCGSHLVEALELVVPLAFQELATIGASVQVPQLLGSKMVSLLVLEPPLLMKIRHLFQYREFIHL